MKKVALSQELRVWITLLALCAIVVLSRAGLFGDTSARVLQDVRNDGPNAVGMDLITQNYYEELLKEDREPEWRGAAAIRSILRRITGDDYHENIGAQHPETWTSLAVVGGTIELETGFLEHALKPNADLIHRDVPFHTNRWGHRDTDDYGKEPEPGVFRIALVGSSNSMGQGVEFHEGFEQIVERRMNELLPSMGGYERYEIINLSVPRYHLLERVYVARHVAPEWNPHMMLVEVSLRDMRRTMYESLPRRIQQGRDLGFDYIREIVRRSDVRPTDSTLRIEQRLQRFLNELVIGSFQEFGSAQRDLGVPIVPIVLRLETGIIHRSLHQLASISENAGLPTLRIFDAYEGQQPEDMHFSDIDFHPTAKGHALLADNIFEQMLQHPQVRSLLLPESRN